MSGQNDNSSARPTPSNQGRIGRIGDWSGTGDTGRSSSGPRFATLRDLDASRAGSSSDSDDDDDDDDNRRQGQEWFAGGERSGLAVQNPNGQGGPDSASNEILKNLLKKARESGHIPGTAVGASAAPAPRSVFSGTGHTLGSDEVESQVVPDPDSTPQPPTEERVVRHITFWRNGFNIENGPLMSYTDPQNANILRALDAGEAPPDLLGVRYGQPVELRVSKRTDEDYVAPKSHPSQAFGGTGHRLGAPTPPIAGASSSTDASADSGSGNTVAASSANRADDAESLQTKFEVDQSQPTTSIQLRLADGTRMLCRMNLTHTVRDIRNFIDAARPENLTRPYTISTTFPNRVLDDDIQTIEAADLKNSVVVQRWITD